MEGKALFVNACVREGSRTRSLAEAVLEGLGMPFEEARVWEKAFPMADEAFLERRDELMREGRQDDPLFDEARRFAEAEVIVMAAPYWDLSFPAALKAYIEQVNVVGITFAYTKEGVPVGLCRAKRLYYVTTAGGKGMPYEYGFGYIQALAGSYYGIQDVRLVKAEGLDIDGADAENIMKEAAQRALAEAERP